MEDAIEEKIEDDIKREFQLERMILFSDAVFAIVITLMAIEIKIPESEKKYTTEELLHHIKLILPTILAYAASFIFIGIVWYKHLQFFGKLKDYNKGLVICNLVLLFGIGLFPFGASLVSHPNTIVLPYVIYLGIISTVTMSQIFLHHYVINMNPQLLHAPPPNEEKVKLKISIITLLCLLTAFIVAGTLYQLIADPESKPLAMLIVLCVPFIKKYLDKKYNIKKA